MLKNVSGLACPIAF